MQRSGIYGADQVVDILMETDVYGEQLTYENAVKTLRRNNLVMRPEEESVLAEKEEEVRQLELIQQQAMTEVTTSGDTTNIASATVAAKQASANLKMLRLRRDVTLAYQQLINSIVRVIDYYNSKNRDAAIDNIIITGIAADFWGFAGLLSQELGRNVEVLKDLAGTNIDQGLHLQGVSLGDYISVIGATLSDSGFKPAEEGKKKGAAGGGSAKDQVAAIGQNDKLPYIVLGIGAAIAVILAVLSLIPYMAAKNEHDALEDRKAQLAPVQDTYNEYTAKKADYDYISALEAATANYNEDLPQIMDDLERALPNVQTVNSMVVSEESITLDVDIVPADKPSIAKMIMDLRDLPYFANVTTNGFTEQNVEGVIVGHYNITMIYGQNPRLAVEEDTAEGEAEQPAE